MNIVSPENDWSALLDLAETYERVEADRTESIQDSIKRRQSVVDELTARAYREAAFLELPNPNGGGPIPLMSSTGEIDELALTEWVRLKTRDADHSINNASVNEALRHAEDAAAFEVPDIPFASLSDALEAKIEPTKYFIEGLAIEGGNVVIAAGYKVGKTTLVTNLVACLVDGCPFLGQTVRPVTGVVTYWDLELELDYAVDQYRRLGIENTDLVRPVPLKGYSLPLTTDRTKEWAIKHLAEAGTEVWIIDTFGKIFDGDENSNSEVREWLHAVEEIKRRAGVKTVIIVTHTGHQREGVKSRARGASYFGGWSDSNWTFDRVSSDPDDTQRLLKVEGRGDLIGEIGCSWDSETNLYSAADVVKDASKKAAADKYESDVWNYVRENADSSVTQVVNGLGFSSGQRNKVSKILRDWESQGLLESSKGGTNATYYRVAQIASATVQLP